LLLYSLIGWLVADGWCWFFLREEYCWLIAGGWFVLREKYCWLVADKPSEHAVSLSIDRIKRPEIKPTRLCTCMQHLLATEAKLALLIAFACPASQPRTTACGAPDLCGRFQKQPNANHYTHAGTNNFTVFQVPNLSLNARTKRSNSDLKTF
jgi:hypothetical protein